MRTDKFQGRGIGFLEKGYIIASRILPWHGSSTLHQTALFHMTKGVLELGGLFGPILTKQAL